MFNLGDVAAGVTIGTWFDTSDLTGAGSALTGGAVRVYVRGNTTEISAGITLTADYDGRTGLNAIDVDLSADPGYAAGNDFLIVLTAGTVGGVALGPKVIAQFSIANRPVQSLSAAVLAAINAEVLDVLNVDTFAQPGQATPAATTSIRLMLAYLYKAWRNRTTQTATLYGLYNDDAATVDQKAVTSDDGTTFDRGEVSTGP